MVRLAHLASFAPRLCCAVVPLVLLAGACAQPSGEASVATGRAPGGAAPSAPGRRAAPVLVDVDGAASAAPSHVERESIAVNAVRPAASVDAAGAASAAASVAPSTAAGAPVTSAAPPAEAPSVAAPLDSAGQCPAGMALVSGSYCPDVEQTCLKYVTHLEEADLARCLEFAKETKCLSEKRVPMRFCMDVYEYPNKLGQTPWTLTSYQEAARLCAAENKRLCTEPEFNFACEGEEMRPYATGFTRDGAKCNFDRPFKNGKRPGKPRRECELSPTCQKRMGALDQRRKSGDSPECVSPFGVYDLNGNVNELVSLPWKHAPHRAAVKGGWWGPVRSRCRPIVTSHDEKYTGYEVGFRCCADAAGREGRVARGH